LEYEESATYISMESELNASIKQLGILN